jgi:hypothetical protein
VSSSDDPAYGPDEPSQGRIFVPEGPMWEAMVAPNGRAVGLSVKMMKVKARCLRRARPRPFGFAPGSAHPVPPRIGEAHGSGTVSSGVATALGLRTAVWTMTIIYGDAANPSAPAARIVSDFHREYQDRDLEDTLLDRPTRWPGRTEAAAPARGQVSGARPEFTSETLDVAVSGRRHSVPMLVLGEFSAFQIRDQGVLVTVRARHMGPAFPEIVSLTDLEPMLYALEHPDREAIAAAFAEKRRQQIEQMRNQTWHRS